MNEKDDSRTPRGEKVRGSIDARSTSRGDQNRWQANRPLENRITAHELSNEDIQAWVSQLRQYSGVGQAGIGEFSLLEGSFVGKLGNEFRTISTTRPDESINSGLLSLARFINGTSPQMLADPRLDPKYKEAYQSLLTRFSGLQNAFSVLVSPPSEATWVSDETTQELFSRTYSKLEKNIQSRLKTTSFWRLYHRLFDKETIFSRSDAPSTNHLSREIAAAGAILISHGYYLTRFLPHLSNDQATLSMISDAYETTSHAAKYLEQERKRFIEIGFEEHFPSQILDPLANIDPQRLSEAQVIWQELIS